MKITDEMRMAVARAIFEEKDVNEMSCHPITFEVIEALAPLIIEECAKVADNFGTGWKLTGEAEGVDRLATAYPAAAEFIATSIRALASDNGGEK